MLTTFPVHSMASAPQDLSEVYLLEKRIDVDRNDLAGTVRKRRDDALGERLGPVVVVPGDRVVAGGRRDDVDVAAVDVGREDGDGAVRRVGDVALGEGDAGAADRRLFGGHRSKQEQRQQPHDGTRVAEEAAPLSGAASSAVGGRRWNTALEVGPVVG